MVCRSQEEIVPTYLLPSSMGTQEDVNQALNKLGNRLKKYMYYSNRLIQFRYGASRLLQTFPNNTDLETHVAVARMVTYAGAPEMAHLTAYHLLRSGLKNVTILNLKQLNHSSELNQLQSCFFAAHGHCFCILDLSDQAEAAIRGAGLSALNQLPDTALVVDPYLDILTPANRYSYSPTLKEYLESFASLDQFQFFTVQRASVDNFKTSDANIEQIVEITQLGLQLTAGICDQDPLVSRFPELAYDPNSNTTGSTLTTQSARFTTSAAATNTTIKAQLNTLTENVTDLKWKSNGDNFWLEFGKDQNDIATNIYNQLFNQYNSQAHSAGLSSMSRNQLTLDRHAQLKTPIIMFKVRPRIELLRQLQPLTRQERILEN